MSRDLHPFDRNPLPLRARAAVVVAHPDDETLWAGGWILDHRGWDWTIVSLCRKSDPDRSPRFLRVLERYGARGDMRDMDDGPDQSPLEIADVEREVLAALPADSYDVLLTHGPRGEYTRHLRHEETSRAVQALWLGGRVTAGELWMFGYEDGEKTYLPRADRAADLTVKLRDDTWNEKYRIITALYGFTPESWEARVTPRVEAFWRVRTQADIDRWKIREARFE
jgi:LmbE family N-acetylglucosaminyl deacetylase